MYRIGRFRFKRLFGTEKNKDILIGLLNRLIPEENIMDVTFLNTELITPVGKGVRKGTVDVYCKCQNDRRIIVEMQNYATNAFIDRAVVYASGSVIENYTLNKSKNYDVKKTYFIAITGTSIFPDLGHAPVRLGLCDLDAETVVLLSEKVLLIFVELPKFAECIEQLDSGSSFLDMFSVAMNTMGQSDEKPDIIQDALIDRMYLAADTRSYDRNDIDQYHLSIMTELEYQATLEDYFNIGIEKGREEGMEKGREEGLEKGMEKGREKGIAIGIKQRDSQIMEAMQRLGYTEKQISALMGAVN